MKTTEEQRQKVAEIVHSFRENLSGFHETMARLAFAEKLIAGIPGAHLTAQSVKNWEDGRKVPGNTLLLLIRKTYPANDWRALMAGQILEILSPAEKEVAPNPCT
jgi:hypothetical protein